MLEDKSINKNTERYRSVKLKDQRYVKCFYSENSEAGLSQKMNPNQTDLSTNVNAQAHHASVITKQSRNRIGRHLGHQGPHTRMMNQIGDIKISYWF